MSEPDKPVLKCASCSRLAVTEVERWVGDKALIKVGACAEHWRGPCLIATHMASACHALTQVVRDRNELDS